MSAPFDEPAQRLAYLRGLKRGARRGALWGWMTGAGLTWILFRASEDPQRSWLFILMMLGVTAGIFWRTMER